MSTDTTAYPADVQRDLDDGFFLTDPDTGFQRAKRIEGSLAWIFKTGYEGYGAIVEGNDIDVGETVAEVNFSHLNADEVSDTAASFYESEKALMDECRNDIEEFAFLICEAYYEINFEGQ